jgi:DHA1 family bicyclomycin/chloramphenicol resistance-like MFS transporter
LLFSRFIQGIGASAPIVLVFAIIADVYKGSFAIKLIGTINATLSILMAGAPILGGFINELIGWRGNYIFVMILTLTTFFLQLITLPETKSANIKLNISRILLGYKQLLSNLIFLSYAFMPSLLFAAYMAYIASSAFLYKGTFVLSNYAFVTHQFIIIASFSFFSILASRITKIFGETSTVRYGFLLCSLTAVLLLILGILHIESEYYMTGFMICFSIGFAICYPVIFSKSLSFLPEFQGIASSIIMSTRALFVFFFTSLSGYLFNGTLLMVVIPIVLGILLAVLLFSINSLCRTIKT